MAGYKKENSPILDFSMFNIYNDRIHSCVLLYFWGMVYLRELHENCYYQPYLCEFKRAHYIRFFLSQSY